MSRIGIGSFGIQREGVIRGPDPVSGTGNLRYDSDYETMLRRRTNLTEEQIQYELNSVRSRGENPSQKIGSVTEYVKAMDIINSQFEQMKLKLQQAWKVRGDIREREQLISEAESLWNEILHRANRQVNDGGLFQRITHAIRSGQGIDEGTEAVQRAHRSLANNVMGVREFLQDPQRVLLPDNSEILDKALLKKNPSWYGKIPQVKEQLFREVREALVIYNQGYIRPDGTPGSSIPDSVIREVQSRMIEIKNRYGNVFFPQSLKKLGIHIP